MAREDPQLVVADLRRLRRIFGEQLPLWRS